MLSSNRLRQRRLRTGELLKDLVDSGFHITHSLIHLAHLTHGLLHLAQSVEHCDQLVLRILTNL